MTLYLIIGFTTSMILMFVLHEYEMIHFYLPNKSSKYIESKKYKILLIGIIGFVTFIAYPLVSIFAVCVLASYHFNNLCS